MNDSKIELNMLCYQLITNFMCDLYVTDRKKGKKKPSFGGPFRLTY